MSGNLTLKIFYTDEISLKCSADVMIVIFYFQNGQNSLTKGHHYCPSFNIVDEILIPNGAKRRIDIEVKNLVTSQVSLLYDV